VDLAQQVLESPGVGVFKEALRCSATGTSTSMHTAPATVSAISVAYSALSVLVQQVAPGGDRIASRLRKRNLDNLQEADRQILL
jgi:hypothetical protein